MNYNRTVAEEAGRKAERRGARAAGQVNHPPQDVPLPPPQAPVANVPDADAARPADVEEEDGIYFAGIANSGPSQRELPKTLVEGLAGTESAEWSKALQEELQNLIDNDVYDVIQIPNSTKPLTSKTVMRIKFDSNGNIERYKLHIVARGFVQKEGVDYKEVFAPVANLESIRIIIALAAKYNLELDQMDVSTAYLNGELEETLYMHPPEGVPIPEGCCWHLKCSLYGLKQAGRTWNRTLDRKLGDLGFTHLDAETCLYVFRDDNGQICFLVVYVDDLLLAATSR